MPQEVHLATDAQTAKVIVERTFLTEETARLEGFDPSFCPDGMEEGIQFFSKNLTAIIEPDSEVSIESVRPTDQPVPEPDVQF